jgi:hypothetical protein
MINDFFPTKTVKFHQNDKFFMTAKLKKMIRARICAYKQGTARFRFLRNRVKYEIRVGKKGVTTITYPEIMIKTTQSGGRRSINLRG